MGLSRFSRAHADGIVAQIGLSHVEHLPELEYGQPRTLPSSPELMSPADTGLLVVDVQEKLLCRDSPRPADCMEHQAARRRGENLRHARGRHGAVSPGPWRNCAANWPSDYATSLPS